MMTDKSKWQPKCLDEAKLPILIMSWICGYGLIQWPLNNIRITLSLVYLIVMSVTYVGCLVSVVLYCVNSEWFKEEERIYVALTLVNVLMMNINIAVAWIHRNVAVEICKQCSRIEDILKSLDSAVNCQHAYKYSRTLAILWVISIVVNNSLTMLWLSQHVPLLINLAIILTLEHPLHVNSCIDIHFALAIKHMEIRLQSVNKILNDINNINCNSWMHEKNAENNSNYGITLSTDENLAYNYYNSNNDKNGQTVCEVVRKRKILVTAISNRVMATNNVYNILQIVKYLHLELNAVSNKIMRMFRLQMGMTMAVTFIVMTFMLYIFYLNLQKPGIDPTLRIWRSAILSCYILTNGIKFIYINHVCSKTVEEYKRAGEIIHRLDIKSRNKDFRNEIQQFSMQLMQNPLVFSPCGLIDLGYPFIRDFAGSVTTYLVILIQMNDAATSAFNKNGTN